MLWKDKWNKKEVINLIKTLSVFWKDVTITDCLVIYPFEYVSSSARFCCNHRKKFSYLRILNTYLRNTTSDTRLNGLALLFIQRDIHVSE